MKTHLIFLVALGLTLAACGTEDKKKTVTVPSNGTPVNTQPYQPQPAPISYNPAPTSVAPVGPEGIDLEPEENKEDFSNVDPAGVPYDPNAAIPYDPNLMPQNMAGYDPQSAMYYQQMEAYAAQLGQPYPVDPGLGLPILGNRYQQYVEFYHAGNMFQRVRPGHGPWDQHRYNRMRGYLGRSQQWLNYDLYNLIYRTLRQLRGHNFRSRNRYDDLCEDAIRRRDHRSAVRYHDLLLEEMRQSRRNNGRDHDWNRQPDRRPGNGGGWDRNPDHGNNDGRWPDRGNNDGRDRDNNGRDRDNNDGRNPNRDNDNNDGRGRDRDRDRDNNDRNGQGGNDNERNDDRRGGRNRGGNSNR